VKPERELTPAELIRVDEMQKQLGQSKPKGWKKRPTPAEAEARGLCPRCRTRPKMDEYQSCWTCHKRRVLREAHDWFAVGAGVYGWLEPRAEIINKTLSKGKFHKRVVRLTRYIGQAENVYRRLRHELATSASDLGEGRPLALWILRLHKKGLEPLPNSLGGSVHETKKDVRKRENKLIEEWRSEGAPLLNGLTPRELAAKRKERTA